MKKSMKVYIKHEVCIWSSLSLNVLIATFVRTMHLGNTSKLYLGIGLMLLCLLSGILKMWRECRKKPGAGAVILDYICLFILSIIIFIHTLSDTSISAIWYFIPAFVVEIIVIFLNGRKNKLSDL